MSKKRKAKSRGLLTLVVDGREARRAVEAAYRGKAYRRGRFIYRDSPADWWTPVGTIVMAGETPADSATDRHQPTPAPQQETPLVTITETLTKAARAVGLAAPVDDREFRECQALLDQKPAALERLKTAHARLTAAKLAVAEGRVEFEGVNPKAAVMKLEHEHSAASSHLARIEAANSRAIGLCPDAGLQRQRRRLNEDRKKLATLLVSARNRVTAAERSVRLAEENQRGLQGQESTQEYRALLRRLDAERLDLAEATEEVNNLLADQAELDRDRETLYATMRTV